MALREVPVNSAGALSTAVANAQAGDAIVLEDGIYVLNGNVTVSRDGTSVNRIFIRARNPGRARIDHCNLEGFKVYGSYWIFEDLEFRGICHDGGIMNAHAFHIVGGASNLIIRNSTIVDFQSHVKLNQETVGGVKLWPNDIWFIGNIWKDSYPIGGTDPHNVLNLDGGLRHVIRRNVFVDFSTSRTDKHQSGIYPKAGVKDAIVEQNLLVCSKRVNSGNTIRAIFPGDAFGSGGICDGDCANQRITYRNNIVMHCQGGGNSGGFVVSNEASGSFLHNTVHDVKWNFYDAGAPGPNDFAANLLYRPWVYGGTPRPIETQSLIPDASGMGAIFENPAIADFGLKDGTQIRSRIPRDGRAPHDFCGNLRAPTTDLGVIDYSHSRAAECVRHIRDLYDRI